MFISHGLWLLRTRRLRREAKEAGLSFDTYPDAVQWQNSGFKLHWRRKSKRNPLDQEAAREVHISEECDSEGVAPQKEISSSVELEQTDQIV